MYEIEIRKEKNIRKNKFDKKIEDIDKKLSTTLKESRDFTHSFISN